MQNVASIIARNLTTLMDDRDIKDGQLSKISKVDQKSIWRIKRQEHMHSGSTPGKCWSRISTQRTPRYLP